MLPPPVSVPPKVRVKVLSMLEALAKLREPPLREIAAWLVRLLTASDGEEVCVTVISENPTTASSPALGTAPPVQFDAVSQSPLTSAAQVIVESSVRSSSRLTSGRNTRRITGDEVWVEREFFRRMRLLLG
jgi:hypothetical protein